MEIARARWDRHEHGPPPAVEYQLETPGEPLLARASVSLVGAIVHAIENAVEAMPKGGRVRLRTARDNGHVLIAVEDSGDGVAQDLPDAFAPLVSTKGSPHLGMGLPVIRSLVSRHGGSVSADPRHWVYRTRNPATRREGECPVSTPKPVNTSTSWSKLRTILTTPIGDWWVGGPRAFAIWRQCGRLMIDLAAVVAANVLAFMIRFEGVIPIEQVWLLMHGIYVTASAYALAFVIMRTYRSIWRYASMEDLVRVIKAGALGACLHAVIVVIIGWRPYPRSVLLLTFVFAISITSAIRAVVRLASRTRIESDANGTRRVIIIGVGKTGESIAREIGAIRRWASRSSASSTTIQSGPGRRITTSRCWARSRTSGAWRTNTGWTRPSSPCPP